MKMGTCMELLEDKNWKLMTINIAKLLKLLKISTVVAKKTCCPVQMPINKL